MAFFREKDYKKQISAKDLETVAGTDTEVRLDSEATAEQEMKSYMRQRYDVAFIFRAISTYDVTATYIENARIEWIEDAYDESKSYLVDDRVSFNGKIYKNIQDSQGTDPSNDLFWTEIGTNEGIYIRVGTDTQAGKLPNDTAFWTFGDDRDAQIKTYFVDISLFHLHPRISPKVIPELRMKRYENAIEWLKKVANGKIETDLTLLLDSDGVDQGDNITYGSDTKLNHDY